MKPKKVVLIGIAVCAISLLLISPVLANEDDYVLGVYGNANEDDTIDMRDLTYVKLIFFGKKPETELADAKYDGKINPLDFIQIKLIIVGKEKELTFIDYTDRVITVKKPIERIVCVSQYVLQTMRSLKVEKDRIAGVGTFVTKHPPFFAEFSKLPAVDSKDYEAILSCNPDFVIGWFKAEQAEKLPGIPVVGMYCFRPDVYVEEVRKLGYILDKKDEAEEFIDFYNGVLNPIKEKVEGIPEEDKPKVYFESRGPYRSAGEGAGWGEKVKMAGGNNIFGHLSGYFTVDPEEVIKRNPEIIVKQPRVTVGFEGDPYHFGTYENVMIDLINEVMNRPELAEVAAVKNKKVYMCYGDIMGGTRHFVGIAYMTKWFHPELFEDLDPKPIHQEYLTRFQGLDIDLDEQGVFVYPEPS